VEDRQIRETVDAMLLEHGVYDPLELLLRLGYIGHTDLQRWEAGGAGPLGDWLDHRNAEAFGALRAAARYAQSLGLEASAPAAEAGQAEARAQLSSDTAKAALLDTRYEPSRVTLQPDLFMPDGASVLEGAIVAALAGGQLAVAAEQVAQLRHRDPGHTSLHGFDTLIQAAYWSLPDSGNQEQMLTTLQSRVTPLARRLLRTDARAYLTRLWRELAQRLAGRPFEPDRPQLHASFAAHRAEDWLGVVAAIETEPHWPERPVLVCRRALALHRLGQCDDALRAWHGLCWTRPSDARDLLSDRDLCADSVRRLWRDFRDCGLGERAEDFPAWHLLVAPDVVQPLGFAHLPDDLPATAAYRTLYQLITARRSGGRLGQEELQLRQALHSIHPGLFQAYLLRFGQG